MKAKSCNAVFTNQQVRVWNMGALCQPLMALKGHSKYVTCVCIHENFVLSGGADCTIKRWDLGTGKQKIFLKVLQSNALQANAFSPTKATRA